MVIYRRCDFRCGPGLAFILLFCILPGCAPKSNEAVQSSGTKIDPKTAWVASQKLKSSQARYQLLTDRLEGTVVADLRTAGKPATAKQYRIWMGMGLAPLRAVVLSRDLNKPEAIFLPPLDFPDSPRAARDMGIPKTGWDDFWCRLDSLEFEALPDSGDEPLIDGENIFVEIKSGGAYRTYSYMSLDDKTDDNHRKLNQICELIAAEFNIELRRYFRPIPDFPENRKERRLEAEFLRRHPNRIQGTCREDR